MAPKKPDDQWLSYVDKLVNNHPYRSLTPSTGRALLEYIKELEEEINNLKGATNMKLLSDNSESTAKKLKEVSDVALATITEHIEYIVEECYQMAGMGYKYLSFTNYQPRMSKAELKGLIQRLGNEHKLKVTVDPYEKEFYDSINIYIEWE